MSTPTLTEQLRRIVTRHCGLWTVVRTIEALNGLVGPQEARAMLDQLVTDGLLAPHGESGDLWTMAPTLTGFTAQVTRQVRAIPGVASASPGEDEGLIGIRTIDGGFFFVEVRLGRTAVASNKLDDLPEGNAR